MNTEKHVIVPQAELDKIEAARLELFQIYEVFLKPRDEASVILTHLLNVTRPMYLISNKKYPEHIN